MPTLNFIDKSETLSDFINANCPDVKDAQRDAACRLLASYNLRRVNQAVFPNEIVVIPDDFEQQLCIGAMRNDSAPPLNLEESSVLRALLNSIVVMKF